AHTLKEAFSRLAVSIAQTEARPELGGVNMIFSAEEVRMATTDGFRLSEYVLPVKWQNTAGDEYPTVIIPAAAAAAMNQILSDAGERDLSVTVDEAQIFFSRGETSVVSRLVAGTYPDYKQIIPSSFAATAVLDRVALERAVRLAGTFSPAAGDMSLVVSPEEKVCLIDAASRERGSNSTRIELLSAEGERQEVFLNTKYLSDGLARCGTERVSLGLSGPTSPVLLKPADEEESPYLYLVMPIRKN
ncbi:MAG TPA: DNA polymerase III subunit beta, partial [Candidatus Moranbacteria bacterium]|nr:DNA polymerase III subunit beta [Candidatus Moranbacteria bacterium]